MSARVWIGLVAGLLVLVAGAGTALWYFTGQAMYRPGDGRANLARSAASPSGAGAPGFWQVTPTISLRHFEAGSGTDVLVVHGGPGFPPLRPWAAAGFTGDRVHWIFYQQRGCGESTRPFDGPPRGNLYEQMKLVEGTLGLGAQVADIERIRRLLGREKLVLVGHSFGGLIAALYAAEFPDHVQALVLVSPADLIRMPARGPDLYELVGAKLPAPMRGEYAAYRKHIFDFRALFREDERSLARTFLDFTRYYGAATGGSDVPGASMGLAAAPASAGAYDASAGGWVTLGLYLSLGRRHDWRDAVRRVEVPVLVLHGARDVIPESQSREVASLFRRAQLRVIPDAGHFSFDEQPREFADALEHFLAERS